MIKKIFIVLSFILLLLIPTSIIKMTDSEVITPFSIIDLYKDKPIGTLSINKINLKENLYNIESPENTVEKHVTILKESTPPENNDSIMLIAAHSGEGKIAYFEHLNELEINDNIKLIYKNKTYTYQVKDIWEEKKDGYININREEKKQLVLTTCSPNKSNYQLVINCIEKEAS